MACVVAAAPGHERGEGPAGAPHALLPPALAGKRGDNAEPLLVMRTSNSRLEALLLGLLFVLLEHLLLSLPPVASAVAAAAAVREGPDKLGKSAAASGGTCGGLHGSRILLLYCSSSCSALVAASRAVSPWWCGKWCTASMPYAACRYSFSSLNQVLMQLGQRGPLCCSVTSAACNHTLQKNRQPWCCMDVQRRASMYRCLYYLYFATEHPWQWPANSLTCCCAGQPCCLLCCCCCF